MGKGIGFLMSYPKNLIQICNLHTKNKLIAKLFFDTSLSSTIITLFALSPVSILLNDLNLWRMLREPISLLTFSNSYRKFTFLSTSMPKNERSCLFVFIQLLSTGVSWILILRGSTTLNSSIFQLCIIILKMKLYVCRNLCANFREIGRKMKKL